MSALTLSEQLQYLATVGYSDEIITSFNDFCQEQSLDEERTKTDLSDSNNSSIIQHLKEKYNWNETEVDAFYIKARQAVQLDPVCYML